MYTVVRLYKIKAGSFAHIAESAQNGFLDIVSNVPGFVGYYMVETGNDSVMTISVFESQEGAYASTTAAAKWIKAHIAEFIEMPPTVIAGDAAIYHTK